MTRNMELILEYLRDNPGAHTPNQIGYAIGAVSRGPRGKSSRVPGPGSNIAAALTSLRRQGLIRLGHSDRTYGTAYQIV